MIDLIRVAIFFRLLPGYNEGVVRGLARYSRPAKPWLFHFFERPDSVEVKTFDPHAGVCSTTDPKLAPLFHRMRIPMVNVGISELAPDLAQVGNDDQAIGQMAARHFIDRGFSNFSYFCMGETPSSTRRGSGFSTELGEAGFSCGHYCGMTVDEWLMSLPRHTAIFAYNDFAAAHVADRCRVLGISLPEQVALVGADNTESLCLLSWPSLSSVEVAAERIGQAVGEIIQDMLDGKRVSNRVVPPIGVVTRRSSDLFAIDDPHVSQAMRFISDNASEPIRVGDVMRVVPVARRTLEVRFRALVGRSVLDEIQRVHLDLAKRFLVTTDWQMPRIAAASGFNDVKRFTTVFHEMVGITPTRYRKG